MKPKNLEGNVLVKQFFGNFHRDLSTDILPGQDSSMKVSLTGLPNKLRGVAWPSSARTLRRAVKSVNERDPRRQLPPRLQPAMGNKREHPDGTASAKEEESLSSWMRMPLKEVTKPLWSG